MISWGQGCGEPEYPGVYAKVSVAIDWISDTLAGWGTARRLPVTGSLPSTPTQAPEPTQPPPVSQACCAGLPHFRAGRAPGVCSATSMRPSDTLNGTAPLPCTYGVNASSAATTCEQLGARLCGVLEVERGALFNAGCYVNFQHVWTHRACTFTQDGQAQAGHYVVRGSGWGARCAADSYAGAMVACCADAC